MQVPTYLLCVLSLGEAFRYLIGFCNKLLPDSAAGRKDGLLQAWVIVPHRPIGHPEMRNGPHKPSRRPPSKPARGDDENRAGIRELDCGEEVEAPRVIRRAEPLAKPEVTEPPPGLCEQRQAL